MKCLGRNLDDHCCYLGSRGVCKHLEENSEPGRRWTCGLRRKLGTWPAVLESKDYKTDVQPFWDEYATRTGKVASCADWPGDEPCGTCGANC